MDVDLVGKPTWFHVSHTLKGKTSSDARGGASLSPGVRLPLGFAVDDDVLPRIKDVILRGLLRYSGGLRH